MMEREKTPPKPKKIKEYQWDPWKDLKDQRPNITYEQLFEIALSIKAQMKAGITAAKPTVRFAEVNTIQERKEEWTSSAYAQCTVARTSCSVIIDTGAGVSIIAKHFLDRLGWEIDKPANTTLVVASGQRSVPLGEIKEVPVQFEMEIIPIRMVVTNAQSYNR